VRAVDIPNGTRIGKLTVIRRAENIGSNRAFLCECTCGTFKVIQGRYLRIEKIKSCGCSKKHKKGGISKHPLYFIWQRMIYSTTNRSHSAYKSAGALGIRVCERWQTFENFCVDMGTRPKNTRLCRMDKMKHYTPENTRWMTPVQMRAFHYPKKAPHAVIAADAIPCEV
jgi:hypothetical protein